MRLPAEARSTEGVVIMILPVSSVIHAALNSLGIAAQKPPRNAHGFGWSLGV